VNTYKIVGADAPREGNCSIALKNRMHTVRSIRRKKSGSMAVSLQLANRFAPEVSARKLFTPSKKPICGNDK
jgi:hypothetical protein